MAHLEFKYQKEYNKDYIKRKSKENAPGCVLLEWDGSTWKLLNFLPKQNVIEIHRFVSVGSKVRYEGSIHYKRMGGVR